MPHLLLDFEFPPALTPPPLAARPPLGNPLDPAPTRWQLRTKLISKRFVAFTCFMQDIYGQLAILCKGWQANSLIISDVVKYVNKTLRAIMKVTVSLGQKEAWLKAACAKDEDANVLDTCALQMLCEDVDEDISTDSTQVLTALKLHIESRFTKVLDHSMLQVAHLTSQAAQSCRMVHTSELASRQPL